jgi:hypothetical protein
VLLLMHWDNLWPVKTKYEYGLRKLGKVRLRRTTDLCGSLLGFNSY